MEPKKTNKFIFVILAIIVVVAGIAIYYGLMLNKPRYIFDKTVNEFLTSNEEITNYNTVKANAELEISVNSNEPAVQEVADLLNDIKFSFQSELDKSAKEELMGVQLTKKGETLLDANIKFESETQNLYMNLGELFDKTILMDMTEMSDETFEITDASMVTLGQKISSKKAETIMKQEVKEQLKDEYFSAEKTTINDKKVTKNVIRLSTKQWINVLQNVCQNLADNQDFIDCFEDGDELKEKFQGLATNLKEIDAQDDFYIEIDIYTTGFMKETERVDIVFEEDDNKAVLQLTKVNDDTYDYELLSDDEKILDGTIKYKEQNNDVSFEMSTNVEGVEILVKLSSNITYDEELSDFDTKNVVNYEELTTEDIYTILGNFMNSELYKMVEGFSNSNTSSLLPDTSDEGDDEMDDVLPTDKTNVSSSLEENVVKTYDDDTVKFNVPDGFEVYSKDSKSYRLFEKKMNNKQIQVTVSTQYSTLDEYMNQIKERAESYKENFENVQLSDVEDLQVNGNQFKKIMFTYDYSFTGGDKISSTKTFIACEIDEKNLYTVEIDEGDLISDHEIEEFLTIQK